MSHAGHILAVSQAVHLLEHYFDIEEGEDQNLAPTVDTTAAGYSFGLPGAAAAPAAGAFNFGDPTAWQQQAAMMQAAAAQQQSGSQASTGVFNFSQFGAQPTQPPQ